MAGNGGRESSLDGQRARLARGDLQARISENRRRANESWHQPRPTQAWLTGTEERGGNDTRGLEAASRDAATTTARDGDIQRLAETRIGTNLIDQVAFDLGERLQG